MAPAQDTQLEKVIDEVLKSGDVHALDELLQRDIQEGTSIKCSQQFITKLNKLVGRSLDKKDSKSACLGLAVLCKCGKNLKLPRDCQGLSGLIAQGLLKMWFEKCRQLWIQCGPKWDETLFNLSEDFFEALMVVHDSCKEGTYKFSESFLYPVGQLAVDPRIYVMIQKEAIRKFNLILDKIPVELSKRMKILSSQEASDIMIKLAGQIMEGGDYDLQTALMEALCRMATLDQRRERADQWFSMEHVASAFVRIRDSEFETDCRKFLNLVNGMQGDRRRVYSYPCLEVYLDKYELLMPSDEKLEEFWIDFNLGSRSISFYFSLADEDTQESQWETICIAENEVQSYTVTGIQSRRDHYIKEGKRHVLQLKLSEVVVVGAVEGSSLTIHFSSSLDILQATRSVYGHSKNKGFVGKTGTSVVKTTVKIMMDENNSQVVPESQLSIGESEKYTAPYLLTAPSAPVQMVTPAKISESSTFISSSTGRSVRSVSTVVPSNTPAKARGKPSLEMVHSSESKVLRITAKTCSHGMTPNSTITGGMVEQMPSKQTNKVGKHKKNTAKAEDVVLAGQGEEQSLEHCFVPDTQPGSGRNTSSNWSKLSVSEILMMPTQKISSLPKPDPCSSLSQQQERRSKTQRLSVPVIGPVSQKQLHTELTQRLQQVINERNQVHQESAAPQPQISDIREDSKDRSSEDKRASTFSDPKEQQAPRKGPAKRKNKGQMSSEVDSMQINTPAKASSTKARQERIPSNINAEANRGLSSKEKRDAELADSMVKLISSRYKSTAKHAAKTAPESRNPPVFNKLNFNMSWLSTAKREVPGAKIVSKSYSKTAASSARQRKDVFAFLPDELLSTGGKDKAVPDTSAISSCDSGIHDPSLHISTAKKGQPGTKERQNVKKHLFSDTDTDQAMTDVSWLRESSRKPKPKVAKYPRQASIKPKAASPHTSHESPDLPPSPQKPAKCNTKPKKKPAVKEKQSKETVEPTAASTRPHAAGRRPQRVAAIFTKSYREPDTDDSQSESEMPRVSKFSSTNYLENAEKSHEAAQATKKKTANKQTSSYVKPESNCYISQSQSVSEQPSSSKKYFVGQQGTNKKSCSEVPEVKKRKSTSSEKSTDTYRRLNSNDQPDLKKPSGLKWKPENVVPEISKLNKRNFAPVKQKMNALKDSWASCQTSFSPSPPLIEGLRSAKRSDPTLGLTHSPLLSPQGSPLLASPDAPCQDSPSPISLLPRPRSTGSSKGNLKTSSFYSAEKKHISSETRSIQSVPSLIPGGQTPAGPKAAEMSPVQKCPTTPPPSPLPSLPLLTSTLIELEKPSMHSPPQSPFLEDTVNFNCHYGFSKVSSVSQISLSLSSTQSSVSILKDSPKTEKSPPSGRELKPAQLHVSGPSRKRRISSSSNFEEEEEEERKKSKMRGQRSPRIKPRKLFNSFTDVSAESEMARVISSHTMSSSVWEAEVGGADMDIDENLEFPNIDIGSSNLYQHFSSELKKKFENRCKMMEVYNKQSLMTVQQHVSSLNMQVNKCRTQRLEQVQDVLLEEIRKLEHDETALKSMEKDLTMYWKRQIGAFHSYQEQEKRRNGALTKALQSNACHSLEYEERLFTSQMCLIRKDMKSVQDRLLSQMQDVEVLSMKRGLHALFYP